MAVHKARRVKENKGGRGRKETTASFSYITGTVVVAAAVAVNGAVVCVGVEGAAAVAAVEDGAESGKAAAGDVAVAKSEPHQPCCLLQTDLPDVQHGSPRR